MGESQKRRRKQHYDDAFSREKLSNASDGMTTFQERIEGRLHSPQSLRPLTEISQTDF